MPLSIRACQPHEIAASREQYARDVNAQLVHWSWLERGCADAYAFVDARADDPAHGPIVGHALVGGAYGDPRDALVEFNLEAHHEGRALSTLRALVRTSGATRVVAQSNDPWMLPVMHDVCESVRARAVLFEESRRRWPLDPVAPLPAPLPDALFRPLAVAERSRVFTHTSEPVGDWCVEIDREVVATGGLLTHYNPPYADLYMEVAPTWRQRGIGSFLVSRLLDVARKQEHLPAARCNIANAASRACLTRAGLMPCGHVLEGRIAHGFAGGGGGA